MKKLIFLALLFVGFAVYASPPEVKTDVDQNYELCPGAVCNDACVIDVAVDFAVAPASYTYEVCYVEAGVVFPFTEVAISTDVGANATIYIYSTNAANYQDVTIKQWRSENCKTCNYVSTAGVISYNRYRMICPVIWLRA